MISRHTTLTTRTGHDALLVCPSSHKSIRSLLSWLDLKEVPQIKGDVTQPALFMTVRREITEPRRETGARSPEDTMLLGGSLADMTRDR